MAKALNKEKILAKIPEEFHKLLVKDSDWAAFAQMWKLDDEVIKTLFPSIPDKIKAIFEWRVNKVPGKRGNRSNLPYDPETIALARELMKCKPGIQINADDGLSGTLLTVQVLVKIQVDDSIKTVSISNIESFK